MTTHVVSRTGGRARRTRRCRRPTRTTTDAGRTATIPPPSESPPACPGRCRPRPAPSSRAERRSRRRTFGRQRGRRLGTRAAGRAGSERCSSRRRPADRTAVRSDASSAVDTTNTSLYRARRTGAPSLPRPLSISKYIKKVATRYNPHYVLRRLLTQIKNLGYKLRRRAHDLTLPSDVSLTARQNFIPRMSFMDMY